MNCCPSAPCLFSALPLIRDEGPGLFSLPAGPAYAHVACSADLGHHAPFPLSPRHSPASVMLAVGVGLAGRVAGSVSRRACPPLRPLGAVPLFSASAGRGIRRSGDHGLKEASRRGPSRRQRER
jgi:hypothetical protein